MLRFILSVFSLTFLSAQLHCRNASAQERGAAFFAIQSPKFPCDNALQLYDTNKYSALAFLWGTFGSDRQCLDRWSIKVKDRPALLQIHLTNEACRRNKRCGNDEIFPNVSVREYNKLLKARDPKLLQALKDRITQIKSFADTLARNNLELVLSTGLEDNYSLEAYGVVLELVRANWPYKVVRNPVGQLKDLSKLSADYIEIHGDTPNFNSGEECIANLDGVDIVFPHRKSPVKDRISWKAAQDYSKIYSKRCRATFVWSAPWQGILTDQADKFIMPKERSFQVVIADIVALKEL